MSKNRGRFDGGKSLIFTCLDMGIIKMRRSPLETTVYLLGVQSIGYLAPLYVMYFITRNVGVDFFGAYSYYLAISLLIQVVLDYGFNLSAARDVAKPQLSIRAKSVIFSSVFGAKIIISVGVFSLALVYQLFSNNARPELWSAVLVAFLSSLVPNWYFQGVEDVRGISIANAIGKVSFVILVYAVAGPRSTISDFFLLNALGLLIPLCWGMGKNHQLLVPHFMFSPRHLRNRFLSGRHIFTTSLASSILSNGPLLGIGFMSSAGGETVGIYAAVEKLVKSASGIFAPVSQALYPHNCRAYSISHKSGVKSTGITFLLFSFVGAISIGLILLGRRVLYALFNLPIGSDRFLFILLPWLYLSILNNALGIQGLSASGNSKIYAYCFNLVVALFIVIVYFLPASIDASMKMPVSLLLSELTLFILLVFAFKRVYQSGVKWNAH